MKAVNSVSISFTPKRAPAACASFQGMPRHQASGEKARPKPRSRLSGAPPTGASRPSAPSTIATSETNTISVAAIFRMISSPSPVPLIRASIELS